MARKQAQLQRYPGSDETDAEGRRLGRREFKETMKALQWLETCQMGWYRNRGRHREALLNMLGGDFTWQGLPKDSGITMRVAKDGQSCTPGDVPLPAVASASELGGLTAAGKSSP